MSNKKKKPRIIDYYSLCTIDCEGGEHIGEWIECDRCGSSVHVRIFEVDHPQHGHIRVGNECFKDVMGYKFGKTHEKALEAREALLAWSDDFSRASVSMQHPPRGRLVALGLPEALTGYKHVPVWMLFADESGYLRGDNSNNYWNASRAAGIRPHPTAPHGWSKRLINAGLDMGLWEYRADSPFELPSYFKGAYVLKLDGEAHHNPTTRQLMRQGTKALEQTPSGRSAGPEGKRSDYSWIKATDWKPPAAVRANAEEGLALRAYNEEVRQLRRPGGTNIGVARAVQLSSGKPITPRAARRMAAYFSRHQKDKRAKGWGDLDKPTPGFVAWQLWGGDEGWIWARRLVAMMKQRKNPHPRLSDHELHVLHGEWHTAGSEVDDIVPADEADMILILAWHEGYVKGTRGGSRTPPKVLVGIARKLGVLKAYRDEYTAGYEQGRGTRNPMPSPEAFLQAADEALHADWSGRGFVGRDELVQDVLARLGMSQCAQAADNAERALVAVAEHENPGSITYD